MLTSIRLRNFRSYIDTKSVKLSRLNVFIGPNNAGKSAFLSAIELLLRSSSVGPFAKAWPLAFEEISSFASFDSVVRRHWTPKEARSQEFILNYEFQFERGQSVDLEYICKGRPTDKLTYVDQATFKWNKAKPLKIRCTDVTHSPPSYAVETNGKTSGGKNPRFYRGLPLMLLDRAARSRDLDSALGQLLYQVVNLEVVHPYRPVPRSYYVLDDPGLSKEDRLLLSFLIDVWKSEESNALEIKGRILDNLKTLGLVTHLDIHQISQRLGPKVFEITVAPKLKRQSVTIADVGFGLSQVLPLAAYDARLEKGYLVAYQPEVHLHPFAQSRLADLFAKSVERGNQVFVETHSPELILRLQAKVVAKELAPSHVRVFCLSNEKGTTQIISVNFDQKGAPEIPWPTGFLDTSLALARELAQRRLEALNE